MSGTFVEKSVLTLFEGKIMIRKYERMSEAGVRGLGGPEVGRGLKQA